MSGNDTGEVRRASRGCDEDTNASLFGRARKLGHAIGSPVGTHDVHFATDAEFIKRLFRFADLRPIRIAAHQDGDLR